jgi:toxin ParE1/3/4
MNIFYTDEAKNDLINSVNWYEEQGGGLSLKSLQHIKISITNIQKFPKKHNLAYKNFRSLVIKRFPYSVFIR